MPHSSTLHYDEATDRFKLASSRDFIRQYAQIYSCRLMELKPILKQKVIEAWPGLPIKSLHEVVADERCVVIGTLYKHMRLKPNILAELGEENEVGKEATSKLLSKYVDIQQDAVILEDELQRIVLERADDSKSLHKLVTGLVVAVVGCESSDRRGCFIVESMVLPGSKQSALDLLDAEGEMDAECSGADTEDPLSHDTITSSAKINLLDGTLKEFGDSDEYLVLVSGLDLRGGLTTHDAAGAGKRDVETLFAFQQLVDALIDESSALRKLAKRIGRVVFGGNLVRTLDAAKDDFASQSRYLLLNRRGNDRFGTGVEALKLVDCLLVQLLPHMHVDLMPGANDPCNGLLPQRPLHALLLPNASSYKTLHRVTNPYEVLVRPSTSTTQAKQSSNTDTLDYVRVVGTSGQNVDDMQRYSSLDDRLSLLHLSLLAAHLMPTAPDTLACYPFTDRDPFVLVPAESPNVYFAANQSAFASRLVESLDGKRTLLVLVPSFALTKSVVLVNLRTLRSFEFALSFEQSH